MADTVRKYFRELSPEAFVEHAKLVREVAEERQIALDGLCGVLTPPLSDINSALESPPLEPAPPGSVDIYPRILGLELVMIQLGAFREGVDDLQFLQLAIRYAYFSPNSVHEGTEIEVEPTETEQA